jgi:glycosyltransferase involved in cell wall biosynthesis
MTSAELISDVVEVQIVAEQNWRPPNEFDHVLYHIGCGRDSISALNALDHRCGPVILHEHVLNQLFVEQHRLFDEFTNSVVLQSFSQSLGRVFTDPEELEDLMRVQRGLQYSDLGLERLVFESGTIIFTHSQRSLKTLRGRYGHHRLELLEFPIEPLDLSDRGAVRAKLGALDSTTVFGSFGFVGSHKRLPRLLRAWDQLCPEPGKARLLVVGYGTDQFRGLAGPSVTLMGYAESDVEFRRLLTAVDIGVQLRGPTLGETSGVVSLLLSSDIPVITSSDSLLPSWAEEALVAFVPPGPDEETQLAIIMNNWITHRPRGAGRKANQPTGPWRDSVLGALGVAR